MRFVICIALFLPALYAQPEIPAWCRSLPRPQFQTLKRIPAADPWFEVYAVASDVFAIYEPHQSEETIGYLIAGARQALLFDTGMGIGDIRKVVAGLTKLPVMVLNLHTHGDHVGGNWQFDSVYGMDTDFTRANARGSREQAQSEIGPGEICGDLPKGFDRSQYATRPWKIQGYKHDGDRIDLGGRSVEIVATPGHTPDSICLFDREHGLLFTGDTYYAGRIWLYRPETDLHAYGASVKRLATLAPLVKIVLGAHNLPVSPPSVLGQLASAFEAVRAGKVSSSPAASGQVVYRVDGMAFLMAAPRRD